MSRIIQILRDMISDTLAIFRYWVDYISCQRITAEEDNASAWFISSVGLFPIKIFQLRVSVAAVLVRLMVVSGLSVTLMVIQEGLTAEESPHSAFSIFKHRTVCVCVCPLILDECGINLSYFNFPQSEVVSFFILKKKKRRT